MTIGSESSCFKNLTEDRCVPKILPILGKWISSGVTLKINNKGCSVVNIFKGLLIFILRTHVRSTYDLK